jgi:heterodisulfide reductase subunit B
VITCCPLCQVNLESYQGKIKKAYGTDPALPAIYFTQLMGVAMGLPGDTLGLGSELVDPRPVLAKYIGNGGGR